MGNITSQQNANTLVQQASEAITCAPNSDCGIAKTANDLEQKYEASKINLRTAPVQLDESEKNYYVYTKGQSTYDQMQLEKVTKKANLETEKKQSDFDENIKKVSQMNDTLHSLIVNYTNEVELYDNYVKTNRLVKQKIEEKGSDIVTNDRKTYYENDNYDTLTAWYKVWWYIYIFLLVAFSAAMLLTPSAFSLKLKAIILLFFVAYPFIIDWVIFFVMKLCVKIGSYIPKNVYLETFL